MEMMTSSNIKLISFIIFLLKIDKFSLVLNFLLKSIQILKIKIQTVSHKRVEIAQLFVDHKLKIK